MTTEDVWEHYKEKYTEMRNDWFVMCTIPDNSAMIDAIVEYVGCSDEEAMCLFFKKDNPNSA